MLRAKAFVEDLLNAQDEDEMSGIIEQREMDILQTIRS